MKVFDFLRQKRWKRCLMGGLGLFVLFILLNGWLAWTLFDDVKQLEASVDRQHVTALQKKAALLPYSSLGLVLLPPMRGYYVLLTQGLTTLEQGVKLREQTLEVMTQAFERQLAEASQFEAMRTTAQQLRMSVAELVRLAEMAGVADQLPLPKNWHSQLSAMVEVVNHLDDLMGMQEKQRYIILLQNNMELRPTGGFMGSYALVEFEKGALATLEFQDIYEPDGQVSGYVPEPRPLSQYLFNDGTPGWRLRDSNWDLEYSDAIEDIDWFFSEGGVDGVDGYVAVTLFLLEDILAAHGPLEVPDYGLRVTADNLYEHAQFQAEHGFFPGSSGKRDFLGSVGRQLLASVVHEPEDLVGELPTLLWQNLEEKQILIHLDTPELQEEILTQGWGGTLWPITCRETDGVRATKDCAADYLYINEANLGVNKANCCIERQVKDLVTLSDDTAKHDLTVAFTNHNPPEPEPPVQWGGRYENYLRLVLPRNTMVNKVLIDDAVVPRSQLDISQEDDKTIVGFLVDVPGEKRRVVVIEYDVSLSTSDISRYQLLIQKQPGVAVLPFVLELNTQAGGATMERQMDITTDRIVEFAL